MDRQHGLSIIDGLRSAQAAGAPVVELKGEDARNFNWVSAETRRHLLGTFCVESGKKFFVLVASTPRSDDDFQFMVFEKMKGSPVLTTSSTTPTGVLWIYQPTKQHGDNLARKKAFLDAAKSPFLEFPTPTDDIAAFSAAVNRAIELRRLADAAGGDGASEDEGDATDDSDARNLLGQLYAAEPDRLAAAVLLAASIRKADALNPKSWCVTNPGGAEKIRLNVGVLRVLDLLSEKVRIIVDPERLDDPVRASLGAAYEPGEPGAKNPFADVIVAPTTAASLPDEVLAAHDAFIARGAVSSSPFARLHHRPAIIESLEALLGEQLPRPATPQMRYWKVSPGENGEQWDECRDGGFIAIGWNKLGDLTDVDHDEFKKLAEETDSSSQVWKFRNIEVGDRIVANGGTKRVLGVGTVTGSYYFAQGGKHAHRLPVHWDDTTERSVEMKGWVKTLIRIKPDVFKQIEAAPIVGATGAKPEKPKDKSPDGGPDFEDILDQLRDESLSFSAELVASYLLALQAKRFVLLTGISGTGKTKLAQEIARAFDDSDEHLPADESDAVSIEAKPYHLKYKRFIVPVELAQEFDALTDSEIRRIDIQVPGLAKSSQAIHKNAGSLLEVLLSGAAKDWFLSNIKLGEQFLISRQTSGEKEWLDVRLPEAGKRRSRPTGPTYELIAVRPDWTDKSAILGFYNPLTKDYIATPVLRLLLRAHEELTASTDASPPRPYFLVFDEMNLARVEHYFSDFLSAMESGDAIHLHEDAQLEESVGIPRRLTLPKNLFVVGTVNVDETTYMFSPKVLDRAFVLEFNEVNFDGIGQAIPSEDPKSTPLALVNMERLEMRGRSTDAEWQAFEKVLGGEVGALLRKIHDALATENRHFGYRVAREVARFVDLAVEQTDGKDAAARAAFDIAVFAKILPKLHGSQAEIEGILKQLLSIALGGKLEGEPLQAGAPALETTAAIPLPQTARKLQRMLQRVRARGFVSFIE